MVAHGVMYDIRYPCQEEALWLAQSPGDIRRMSGTSVDERDLIIQKVKP